MEGCCLSVGRETMSIHEFHFRFVSRNESGLLFSALRRLSQLNDLKSLAFDDVAWGEWPDSGGDGNSEFFGMARA
jgi:hypothetical protein